jgi:hypothetical protein
MFIFRRLLRSSNLKFKIISFQEDLVVTHSRKEKLKKFDKMLKSFEHSKALDEAM